MKFIIDANGGDNSPSEIVKGALEALKTVDCEICLIGIEEDINKELEKYSYNAEKVSVVNCTESITCEEAPARAVRRKKDSSIVKGITMVKEEEGDVFISAGSSGAVLVGATLILGRIKGISRPALASVYPILGSEPSLLVDAGANADCRVENLVDFAIMGSVYMEKVLGRINPRVGLVNNGAEEEKGSELTKKAYQALKETPLNFIGNVESREVPDGVCDVIVTDGFTGNALLKLTEGLAKHIMKLLVDKFTADARSKIGALALKPKLYEVKDEFDYSEYGGAPILGVKGGVIKIHGSSDANAVKNAIIKAVPFVEKKVVRTIEKAIENIE
ncbi:MAG: phosphate acyltransferase PlsX [Clostridia bacterium]|nr:phosphate acyltransferase PlsX [Clostridia bacterium]